MTWNTTQGYESNDDIVREICDKLGNDTDTYSDSHGEGLICKGPENDDKATLIRANTGDENGVVIGASTGSALRNAEINTDEDTRVELDKDRPAANIRNGDNEIIIRGEDASADDGGGYVDVHITDN